MNGKLVNVSHDEKYLGVIIDSKLTFDSHISAKVNKANSMMGLTNQAHHGIYR